MLPVISKQPKYLIHTGTDDALRFTTRDILNKFFQLKAFIQEILPAADITISTPTLRLVNGITTLMVRQPTKHLLNLKILIFL